MTATIGEAPPDNQGGHELATRVVASTAFDYDQALEECQQQMPAGWRVLYVRVAREQ